MLNQYVLIVSFRNNCITFGLFCIRFSIYIEMRHILMTASMAYTNDGKIRKILMQEYKRGLTMV